MKIYFYNTKILLIILVFTYSCDHAQNYKRDLNLLKSSDILLPKQCLITIKGKDSLINNYIDSELKLINYTDSINCQTCVIGSMHKWNTIIEYTKLFNNKIKCYFILAPKHREIDYLRNNLSSIIFDYPIMIDTIGEFEKLNPHLPKNKAMHTFLLDENNKVILVGNPLYNKEIEKLFYKITQEKLGK